MTSVVSLRHHARSGEQFEMLVIGHNQFVRDLPKPTHYALSKSRPFRSLGFLTPGTSDVISAALPSPLIFGHFRPSV